jgi:hypothetical protein
MNSASAELAAVMSAGSAASELLTLSRAAAVATVVMSRAFGMKGSKGKAGGSQ